jgi:TIR domain/Trypsin-like peptidase domain
MPIFGNTQQRPTHWLKTGLAQARRVGRVEQKGSEGRGIGSGFVVDGSVFGQALDRLPIFVTAGHVISSGIPSGLVVEASDNVTIVFQGMFDDTSPRITAECRQVLAGSMINELNYTLLLLDHWPGPVADLLVAPRWPQPGSKIFVISYPQGGGLAIALDDNDVVAPPSNKQDMTAGRLTDRLFYHAPTEPGSSGGAVFNQNWEIVGIHNGGNRNLGCNWGVAFDVVVLDARRQLEGRSISNDLADAIRATARPEEIPPPETNPNYFSVFISYSHADSIFANRLYNSLQARGIRAWLDEKQMHPGDDIYEEVQKGIQLWDKLLLCASKASLTSWWVDSEIDRVFEKERNLFKERNVKVRALIPLQLDDFLLTQWESGKAQEVKSRIAADFRRWEDQKEFETKFDFLVSALRADAGAREAPPVSKI